MLITSTPTNAAALMSLVASVCVYIYPVRALTFESLERRIHFEFTGTSLEQVGQVHMSRSQQQNGIYKCNQIHTFTGGLSLIKSRSHFQYTRIKSRYTMNYVCMMMKSITTSHFTQMHIYSLNGTAN